MLTANQKASLKVTIGLTLSVVAVALACVGLVQASFAVTGLNFFILCS